MFKKNDDFFADIADTQTIFIDTENGIFYLLPILANLVFKFLTSGKTLPEIFDIFAKIDGIPSDYQARIQNVFDNLTKYKLIVECNDCDCESEPELTGDIIQGLQESNFANKIEPSNDVQQLLLDDPIHDVSLDGWTPIAQ